MQADKPTSSIGRSYTLPCAPPILIWPGGQPEHGAGESLEITDAEPLSVGVVMQEDGTPAFQSVFRVRAYRIVPTESAGEPA